jgi:hypothetical protein
MADLHSTPDPVGDSTPVSEGPAGRDEWRRLAEGAAFVLTGSEADPNLLPAAKRVVAERDRLREALEPFAKFADRLDGVWAKSHGVDPDEVGEPQWEDDEPIYDSYPIAAKNDLLVAHFRKARSALNMGTDDGNQHGTSE